MVDTTKRNNVVTDLRELISKRVTKNVPFMGSRLEINKLTLAECNDIQRVARDVDPNNPEKGFDLLRHVIRLGVPAANDFSDEDFANFPMEDMNKLADEVLKYAGMDPNAK